MKVSVTRKLSFTAITVISLFAAGEAILRLAGVRPVLYDEDPYVGFSSQIPLFVERDDPNGGAVMVTADNKLALFNPQQFTRNKRPGTRRVFCVGGSTTFGRPYDDMTSFCGWLREMLLEADPSVNWELINAGGVSYASYRVAALVEELIRYEPDLFIIYSGHNEFLERRTYSRIISTPRLVRGLGAVLSGTRIYAALSKAVDRAGGRPAGEAGKRAYLPGEVKTILERSLGPQEYHRDDELRQKVFDHYREALRIDPDHAEANGSLACALTEKGKLDEAISFYRRALKLKPDCAEVHHRLARTLVMAGQFDQALEQFRRAAQLKPDWPDPLNGIAQILLMHPDAKVRNAGEAVSLAERAAEMTEYQDAYVLETLSAAYAAAGRFHRAATTAQAAMELALANGSEEHAQYLRTQLQYYRNLELGITN